MPIEHARCRVRERAMNEPGSARAGLEPRRSRDGIQRPEIYRARTFDPRSLEDRGAGNQPG